jgi:hypothetical protein
LEERDIRWADCYELFWKERSTIYSAGAVLAGRHDAKYEERHHSPVVGRPWVDADMAKIGVALRSFTFSVSSWLLSITVREPGGIPDRF